MAVAEVVDVLDLADDIGEDCLVADGGERHFDALLDGDGLRAGVDVRGGGADAVGDGEAVAHGSRDDQGIDGDGAGRAQDDRVDVDGLQAVTEDKGGGLEAKQQVDEVGGGPGVLPAWAGQHAAKVALREAGLDEAAGDREGEGGDVVQGLGENAAEAGNEHQSDAIRTGDAGDGLEAAGDHWPGR